jgi:hypothetical protein
VVHQPVHRRHGHGPAGEDVVPLPERLVTGHQQGAALVAVADQLKQHRGLQLTAAHVGDVVDHQQGVAIELLQHCRQVVGRLGLLQQLHQRRGREEAAGLVLRSHCHRDGNGQVGLAHATGTKQQQVFRLQQPGGLPRQALELLPLAGLEVLVVKAVETLLPGEVGAAQQTLLAGDLPLFQLLLTEGIEELAWAPALGLRLLGQRLPVAAEARQLELFEQQRQCRFHRR